MGGVAAAGQEDALERAERLAPHANVPLTAQLPPLPQEGLRELAGQLVARGVSGFFGTAGAHPDDAAKLGQFLAQAAPVPRHAAEEETLAACSTHTFFLREDMAYSDLLECSVDMADQVISAEDAGCEILQIHIGTLDDAYQFGLNADLMRLPVSLVADNLEALETALILYNGRAIIDRLTDLEEESVLPLAQGYNALVL